MSDETECKRDERGRILPGYTANPNGRPKGTSFGALIEKVLNEILENGDGTMTRREALVRALVSQATEGNVQAAKELLARLWPAETAIAVRASAEREPVTVRQAASLDDMAEALRIVAEVSGGQMVIEAGEPDSADIEPLAVVSREEE